MGASTDHDTTMMRLFRLERELAEENDALRRNVRDLHDRTSRAIRHTRRAVRHGVSAADRDRSAEAYEVLLRRRKMLAEALGTLNDLRRRIEAGA